MVAQVKPTKKNSPAVKVGANPNNQAAPAYYKEKGEYVVTPEITTDPNTLTTKQMTRLTGAPRVSMGDPGSDKVKTDGIKQRGHGAAVKGFTSRGPLA